MKELKRVLINGGPELDEVPSKLKEMSAEFCINAERSAMVSCTENIIRTNHDRVKIMNELAKYKAITLESLVDRFIKTHNVEIKATFAKLK
jgi:hypothetical protein